MEQHIIYREIKCEEGEDIYSIAEQVEALSLAEMTAQGGRMTEKQLWILKQIGLILLRIIFHIPPGI